MKHLIFIILLVFSSINVFAQQDARYSLFHYNYLTSNPAMAGVKGRLNSVMLHREQWAGGSVNNQKTTNINLDMPLYSLSSGIGLNLSRDQHGILEEYTTGFNYAVVIGVSEYGNLSFGMNLGLHHSNVNFSKIQTDPNNQNIGSDENFNYGNNTQKFSMSYGLGLYYSDRFLKIGFSAPVFSSYEYYALEELGKKTEYYITTVGFNFQLSQRLSYNLRSLFKIAPQTPFRMDMLNQFVWNDKLAGGISFRSGESFSGFVAYTFSKQFNIAYSYDLVILNELKNTQSGSHEIALNFLFNFPKDVERERRIGMRKRVECADFTPKKKREFIKEVEDLIYDRN